MELFKGAGFLRSQALLELKPVSAQTIRSHLNWSAVIYFFPLQIESDIHVGFQ